MLVQFIINCLVECKNYCNVYLYLAVKRSAYQGDKVAFLTAPLVFITMIADKLDKIHVQRVRRNMA